MTTIYHENVVGAVIDDTGSVRFGTRMDVTGGWKGCRMVLVESKPFAHILAVVPSPEIPWIDDVLGWLRVSYANGTGYMALVDTESVNATSLRVQTPDGVAALAHPYPASVNVNLGDGATFAGYTVSGEYAVGGLSGYGGRLQWLQDLGFGDDEFGGGNFELRVRTVVSFHGDTSNNPDQLLYRVRLRRRFTAVRWGYRNTLFGHYPLISASSGWTVHETVVTVNPPGE